MNRRRYMGGGGTPAVIIMTSASNAEVMAVCYAKGWAAHADYMTRSEAEAVTSIDSAFNANTSITHFDELQYFTGLTEIGTYAFYQATNLASVVLPDTITHIGDYGLGQVDAITQIVFPQGITSIGRFGLAYMDSLNILDLSGTELTSLADSAVQVSTALTKVILPSTIVSIGANCFNGCTSVSQFIIYATTPPSVGGRAFRSTTGMFYVPDSVVDTYKTNSSWSSFASRIKGISEIPT